MRTLSQRALRTGLLGTLTAGQVDKVCEPEECSMVQSPRPLLICEFETIPAPTVAEPLAQKRGMACDRLECEFIGVHQWWLPAPTASAARRQTTASSCTPVNCVPHAVVAQRDGRSVAPGRAPSQHAAAPQRAILASGAVNLAPARCKFRYGDKKRGRRRHRLLPRALAQSNSDSMARGMIPSSSGKSVPLSPLPIIMVAPLSGRMQR